MRKISSSLKVCATCVYWGGERVPDRWGRNVDVSTDRGKCLNPKGSWKGSVKFCTATCKDYSKWQQLK